MKPSPFLYHRPGTVAEAVVALADAGGDGKVLAGGQSLVPMMNMRLAAPGHLVDINQLSPELSTLSVEAGAVRIGALIRHSATARAGDHATAIPLLAQATRHVAHETIRNRGTTVGSIVHADPAGEMPAVLLLCDGAIELVSTAGTRRVAAADFFIGPLESALRSGELATSAIFEIPTGRTGSTWVEVSRRHGDFAMCGLGMVVTLDEDLRIERARAAYVSVGPTPVLVDLIEAVAGQTYDACNWAEAGNLAAASVLPETDIHASADYRRHLVRVLTVRAGEAAAAHALRKRDTTDGES